MTIDARQLASLSPLAWGRYALGDRITRPPHLRAIERAFLRVASGQTKRLMIFAPPRHAKSVTVSQLGVGWWLGTHPNDRVAVISHTEDLAAGWGRKARDMLAEHGRAVFGVSVRTDVKAAARWDLAQPHEGGFLATGLGGPLTGKGFDLIVLDDVVKNSDEAFSEAQRKRTWDFYTTTVRSRLQPGGAMIALQTRWHSEDLAGRLLREAAEGHGEKWETLTFRAIAEEGDERRVGTALWPEHMPVSELEAARIASGPLVWSALWQQRPSPAEGALFKRSQLAHRYTWISPTLVSLEGEPPIHRGAIRVIAACDVALSLKRSADYSVIAILGQVPDGRVLLMDLLREKLEAPDLVKKLRSFAIEKHGAPVIYVEREGCGLAIIQNARRDGLPILESTADSEKYSRALPLQSGMDAGRFLLPERAPWLELLEDELLTFPAGRHDDMLDALAHGWNAVGTMAPPSDPGTTAFAARADLDSHFAPGAAAAAASGDDGDGLNGFFSSYGTGGNVDPFAFSQ